MRGPLGRGHGALVLQDTVASPVSTVPFWRPPATAVKRPSYGSNMISLRMRFDGYRRATTSTASWYCLTPARCRTTMPESAYAGSCEPELCLLCDTPYTSWTAHTREHAHVARSVVCRFFVMPERSESIMQHLERHIALDLKEVDALTARKVERRRERLLAGLVHLVEKGVLRYSIPTLPSSTPTGGKTGRRRGIGIGGASLEVNLDRFLTCVLVGEAFLRREVLDRCARLIPSLKAVELNSVVAYLTSTRQVARIFDELSLLELLVARAESDKAPESATTVFARVTEPANVEPLSATAEAPSSGSDTSTDASSLPRPSSSMPAATPSSPIRWNLSHEDKAYIMCACLGELHRFHEQERPRSVASKAAADAIVLNVLAGHGRENLVSELVHDTLQRMVDEGTVIWRQHQEDVKRRGLSSEANLTAKNGIGEQSALDMDGRVSEGLRYMRTAPLASKPSPPSVSVGALDSAAAERLVSSYLPFKDIDQLGSEENEAVKATTTTPSRSSTDDTCIITTPDFIAALHTSAKNWKPLTAELRQRGKDWHRLPFAPSSPELKVWKKPR